MSQCITCDMISRRDAQQAPLWDSIYRTPFWDLVHSYNSSLPGWLVLVSRRHITAVDEMTTAEAAELGLQLREVSIALKEVTGCVKTYVVQFAEAAQHPHVHFHVVPRMADLPDDRRGPKVFADLGVPEDERVSEAVMNDIAARVRELLFAG